MKDELPHPRSTAFLLAQVGAAAAARFAERVAEVGLTPAHAGILRLIRMRSGISQQSLSSLLGILPSRLVVLLDELERRGLVERHSSSQDRRAYALQLTGKGLEVYESIGGIARAHDDAICSSLGADERERLGELLRRIADQLGLTPGVHPGFSRLAPAPGGGRRLGVKRRRRRH
jgi:DNA-binding MarR family transcriptional regulator